ncbi:hypothetical protein L1887_15896 [Cichorium endivia]|nr:hypothetical protein L1887_15896 [Cichorium endivia]
MVPAASHGYPISTRRDSAKPWEIYLLDLPLTIKFPISTVYIQLYIYLSLKRAQAVQRSSSFLFVHLHWQLKQHE